MPRPPADLTGRRYGKLTVLALTDQHNSYGQRLYRCRCDCGGERLASRNNLQRGEITSCGCQNHLPRKNLAGQRFGRLTALAAADPPDGRKRTSYKWLCRCDCGNTAIVSANSLTKGNAQSCGCLQREAVRALFRDGTAPCKLRESDRPRASNTSGCTGVSWDAARQKWAAEIRFRGIRHFLGRYSDKRDAIAARKEAEARIFGDYLDSIGG